MTEFSKYPEEMASEILSRTPPKTLMRFKCVRKSWCIFIDSPSFVAKHLSNSLHNKQSTCIFCKRYVFTDIACKDVKSVISLITFSYDHIGNNDHEHITHSVIQDIDLPLSMSGVPRTARDEPELLGAVYIVGHCDGIICLVHDEIVLWNPAIKQIKILPKPLFDEGVINSIGFGYDARSKDYKVFSFPTHDGDGTKESEFNDPPQAQVYSLSTDSWTEINAGHLETETTNLCPQFFQMYFNGFLYWIGFEKQKEYMCVYDTMDEELVRQLIIVFDMNGEVFEDILFPNSLYDGPMIPLSEMRVIVWNGSVTFLGQFHFGDADDSLGLWVMDDIVRGSWTKQLTVELIDGTQMVLEIWKSDEILMVANDNRIFSYNIRTEEIKYLPIESAHPTFSAAIVCVNSLVPVIDGRQSISNQGRMHVNGCLGKLPK